MEESCWGGVGLGGAGRCCVRQNAMGCVGRNKTGQRRDKRGEEQHGKGRDEDVTAGDVLPESFSTRNNVRPKKPRPTSFQRPERNPGQQIPPRS